jgi:hypothetical protein
MFLTSLFDGVLILRYGRFALGENLSGDWVDHRAGRGGEGNKLGNIRVLTILLCFFFFLPLHFQRVKANFRDGWTNPCKNVNSNILLK